LLAQKPAHLEERRKEVDCKKVALLRGGIMKFAKAVFWVAGIWGVLVLTPLYFLYDVIGKQDPPPITHPGFYYGFVGVGLAWQIAFLIIAQHPVRYRMLIIPSILEKFLWSIAVMILVMQKRMHASDLIFAGTDGLLGVLFVAAWVATGREARMRKEMRMEG
jgi:hypothetical protein